MPSQSNIYGQPLVDRGYIRLLTRQNAYLSCALRCTLRVVPFGTVDSHRFQQGAIEPYDAVSYVWGPPQDLRLVYCNNEPVHIPRNLRNALRLIWRKQPKLRIWADRLCINQADIEEKENQVAMMGLIFETARCVHIWIGDPIGSTKWTLRYIRRTQQKAGENLPLNEVTPLLDSQLVLRLASRLTSSGRSNDSQEHAERSQLEDLPSWLRCIIHHIPQGLRLRLQHIIHHIPHWLSYYLDSIHTRLVVQQGSSAHSVTIQAGLQDLAGRPWFYRAWTLQEVLLAKHATLRCGSYELEWSVWVQGLEQLLKENIFDSHTQFLLKQSKIDTDMDVQTLSQLLVRSWTRVATDPRDKLFSLLALTEGRDKLEYLLPNYRLDERKTYIRAARACIIDDGDLGIIGAAGFKPDRIPSAESGRGHTASPTHKPGMSLPSWVPNWQDPTSRPRGFSPNDLARAWVSQNRGDTLGQIWPDDLSDFLVLHGIGVGRFRLPPSSVDESSSASEINGGLLLDAMPPCSIPTSAAAIGSQTKSHAGAGLLFPRPFDVQVSVAVKEAARHDLRECACSHFSLLSPSSGCNVAVGLKLHAQNFPEGTQPGDWLCAMKGAQRLYVIRPLPATTISASMKPARRDLRQRIKVRPEDRGNPSYEQTFNIIGELHPTTNDGDAIVLEHCFSRASNGAEPCKCAWCIYSSSLQPLPKRTVRKRPQLQWDKLWTFLASCVRGQFVLC